MDEFLRSQVWARAANRCEYCLISQSLDILPFQIDHIIALKHHVLTIFDNLALSCYSCNVYKGPNIAGFDLQSRAVTRLYHPRQEHWREHFRWHGAVLVGSTPFGRVTTDVLNINSPERVEHRRLLLAAGLLVLHE
ncbi:MAG: HNH endonuclease [Gemmataceae bacterium]|nr:HNH endonuclease [Gemmataceae bacterium]